MALADDVRATISLLRNRFNGRANGRATNDVVLELAMRPSLPVELAPVLLAMHAVSEAKDAEHAAYEHRIACETRLAELVEVRRRDKDTGFEAEVEAERVIVEAAIASVMCPIVDPVADAHLLVPSSQEGGERDAGC